MTEPEILEFISYVEGIFNRTYIQSAKTNIIDSVKGCSLQSAVSVSGRLERDLSKGFPDPRQLITLVKDEEARSREDLAGKEKRAYADGTARAMSENKAIVKDTMLVIRSVLAGAITRGEALQSFRHLDSMYPSAGFATEGAKLQRHYEDRSLSLSGRCGSYFKPVIEEELSCQ